MKVLHSISAALAAIGVAFLLLCPVQAYADTVLDIPTPFPDSDYTYQLLYMNPDDSTIYLRFSSTQFANGKRTVSGSYSNSLIPYGVDSCASTLYVLDNGSWVLSSESLAWDGSNSFFYVPPSSSTYSPNDRLTLWTSHDIVMADTGTVYFEAGYTNSDYTLVWSGGLPGVSGGTDLPDYSGFLGSIIGWLSGISDGISGIADSVFSFFEGFFSNLGDTLLGLVVPSDGWFQTNLDLVNAKFTQLLGFDRDVFNSAFEALVSGSDFVEDSDFTSDLSLGSWSGTVSFVDTSYLLGAIEYFRPVIRGLFVLLWVFFCVNQVLAILGVSGVSSSGQGQVPGQLRMDI